MFSCVMEQWWILPPVALPRLSVRHYILLSTSISLADQAGHLLPFLHNLCPRVPVRLAQLLHNFFQNNRLDDSSSPRIVVVKFEVPASRQAHHIPAGRHPPPFVRFEGGARACSVRGDEDGPGKGGDRHPRRSRGDPSVRYSLNLAAVVNGCSKLRERRQGMSRRYFLFLSSTLSLATRTNSGTWYFSS